MVDILKRTQDEVHAEEESQVQNATQPQQELLTIGEHAVYATRPLIWPSLIRPALLIITGITIFIVSRQIQLEFPVEIEELISATLVTSIIGWFGLLVLCSGLLKMLIRFLRWRYTAYTITNRRILRQTGIIGKSYVDCSLGKVQTLYLSIPTLGRLLDFGTIRIATAGTDSTEIQWEGVRHPREAHRILNETIERYEHDNA